MAAIAIKNLSKTYRRYPSRWARLAEWIDPGKRSRHQLHWALKDVSLEIEQGMAVGVVGLNGAGKSTLLKLLTGTSTPTHGSIQSQGQVSALLELGMGFHPDFTGRQNAYMAAQLMGLQASEIRQMLPHIESFAELGTQLDDPVRTYSSGMQMRLAFSVATARRPDILIVDEALSVGDAYFQHKSFERIRSFKDEGTTLLLVSHDKQAILNICDHCILLHEGSVFKQGSPELVLDYYNAMLANDQAQQIKVVRTEDNGYQITSGTGEARVIELRLLNEASQPINIARVGQVVTLQARIQAKSDIPRLVMGYGIKDRVGQVMYGTNTQLKGYPVQDVKSGNELIFEFQFAANLGPGEYSVQTSLASSATHLSNNYEWRDRALLFKVVNATGEEFSGCNWMNPIIRVKRLP